MLPSTSTHQSTESGGTPETSCQPGCRSGHGVVAYTLQTTKDGTEHIVCWASRFQMVIPLSLEIILQEKPDERTYSGFDSLVLRSDSMSIWERNFVVHSNSEQRSIQPISNRVLWRHRHREASQNVPGNTSRRSCPRR